MKYLIKTLCVLAVMTLSSCGQNESNSDGGQTAKPAFAKGADIGWYTEMEKKVNQAIVNIPQLIKTYNRDVMLVEFGMPAAEPQKGKEALETLWNGLKDVKRFKGIFYWEPESEPARNGYALGAFNDGKPTIALSPFSKPAD